MIQLKYLILVAVCIAAIMGYILFFATGPSRQLPYPYRKGNVVTLKLDGRNAVVVDTARDHLMVKFPFSDEEVKIYPTEILEFKK